MKFVPYEHLSGIMRFMVEGAVDVSAFIPLVILNPTTADRAEISAWNAEYGATEDIRIFGHSRQSEKYIIALFRNDYEAVAFKLKFE